MDLRLFLFLLSVSALIAVVEETTYVVFEPEGQVTVCVLLLGSDLGRPVTVEVSTGEIGSGGSDVAEGM